MKKFYYLLVVLLSAISVNAQTVVFSEDFELPSLADSVVSTGTPTWDISTTLFNSGLRSDSNRIAQSDSSALTTTAFSTMGSYKVYLEFSHICKIDLFDFAEIWVSNDNGSTWKKLVDSLYLGTGQFGSSIGDRFASTSYPDWLPADNNAIPTNSWWKDEKFDISSIAGNAANVMVRFELKDRNSDGNRGAYGWLIDDIKVWVPPSQEAELVSYNLPFALPSGCGVGNEVIEIKITNTGGASISGNLTASFQRIGDFPVTETVPATILPGDTHTYTFLGKIDLAPVVNDTDYVIKAWVSLISDPIQSNDSLVDTVSSKVPLPDPVINDTTIPYGTGVLLHATHTDTISWYSDPLAQNQLQFGSYFQTPILYDTTTYYVQAQAYTSLQNITIGTGTSTENYIPCHGFYDYGWSAMIYNASEIGTPGKINSIAFYVGNTPSNYLMLNQKVYLAHTTDNSFATADWIDPAGLHLGFSGDITWNGSGWHTITLTTPFYYDGTSNLLIYWENQDGDYVTGYPNFQYTSTSPDYMAKYKYQDNSFPAVSGTRYYNRPNLQLSIVGVGGCPSRAKPVTVNISGIPQNDAGVVEITEPAGLVSGGTFYPVKVKITNEGIDTLKKVTINWSVDDTLKTPYVWTGSLARNAISGEIKIDSISFSSGLHTIKAWTSLPNDSNDIANHNDTASASALVCLDGTYTIGGVSADFPDIQTALDLLDSAGVCGPVTFNIASGTYTGQITLNEVTGVSDVNTITFQSAVSDPDSVTITYAATGTSDNYVVDFNGGDYFILKNLTLSATGASYSRVLTFGNIATGNKITGCKIIAPVSSSTSTNYVLVYSGSGTSSLDSNNTFESNTFINGSYGLYWYGGGSTSLEPGTKIINNNFIDQYYRGAVLYYQDAPVFEGNSVETNSAYTSAFYGLQTGYCDNAMRVLKNKIFLSNPSSYGIYIYYCDGTAGTEGLTANNFVSIGGTSTVYGIYSYYSSFQKIYHNSVSITSTGTTARAFYLTSSSTTPSTDNELYNNIFAYYGTATGYAIYVSTTASISSSDYNNLYAPNATNLGYWGSTQPDLAAWQTASGQDANSLSADPGYATTSDLHVNAIALDGMGTPLTLVTDDIDGEPRDPSTPDIGADEFSPAYNDAGVIALVEPVAPCPGTVDIKVEVKNFGIDTLFNVSVEWEINTVSQSTYNITNDTVPPNESKIYTIGSYTFIADTLYDMKFWTTSPNGVSDQNTLNDTLALNGRQTAIPGGTYTIGGTSPDYATFADAIADLNAKGVCGPVIFNVDTGTYNEQLTFMEVDGASSTNTITFQAANGDSSGVILSLPSQTSSTNNHLIYLDGADYITFKKMTFERTGTNSYARAILLDNAAHDNTFESCRFLGVTTTSSSTNMTHIYSDGTLGDTNIVIKNCRFINNSYGIYLYGTSTASSAEPGIQVTNNIFEDQYAYVIYLYGKDAPIVTENTVTSQSSNTSFYGIYMYYCDSGMVVTGNKISVPNGAGYGIYLYSCDATGSATSGLISNNFIHTSSAATSDYGIYCSSSYYQNIYNNSINITGTSGRAFYLTGGGDIDIVNNIFANHGGGEAAYYSSTTAGNVIDYNNYYTTGNVLAYWGGSQTSLVALQVASGKDANSVSVDPRFSSDSDLHCSSVPMDNKGTPLAQVTDDIDGEARSLTTPDIGADEYASPANDLAVTELTVPQTGCGLASAEDVTVKITNVGSAAQSNIPVKYSIDGGTTYVTETIAGPVAFDSTVTYTFTAKADLLTPGNYQFVIIVDNVGDEDHSNDTLKTVVTSTPTISTFPYLEDFEGTFSGWSSQAITGTDQWELGDPEKVTLDTAHSGQNVWVTKLTGNYDDETECVLNSPCIDLTSLTHPMVSVWLNFQSEPDWDGLIFEASTDSGATWTKIGDSTFYNNMSTLGNLPPPKWNGNSNGWKRYKTELTSLAGQSSVKLRFRFNSDANTNGEGYAIDDILIYQKPANDAAVQVLYTLGKLPKDMGQPHTISTLIENAGINDLMNLNVTLNITGANSFTDVQVIDTLKSGTIDTVYFGGFSPTSLGQNTITVSVPADDNSTNNSFAYGQQVTDNSFAYADTSAIITGIGYASGEGALLTKYHVNSYNAVDSVRIWIRNSSAVGKTVYGIVLNQDSTVVGRSPDLTLTATDVDKYVTFPITDPAPPVFNDEDFYVGLALTGTTASYPLGVQEENPPRWNTYFGSALDGSALIEYKQFGRFVIEAVMGNPPALDATIAQVVTPVGGCGLGSETVSIMIRNLGTDTIKGADSALTAGFTLIGGATVNTEYALSNIPPGDTLIYTFIAPVDLSTTVDSAFEVKAWVNLDQSLYLHNDTIIKTVNSLRVPADPITVNDTVPYATSATLSATATDKLLWYDVPVGGSYLDTGEVFVTPVLYDTTTFYVEARSPGGSANVRITEITQFETGTGYTNPYPTWITGVTSGDFDGLEITNLGSGPADLSGYTINFYSTNTSWGVNGSWTFPNGTVLQSGEISIIDIKSNATGTNPAYHYYCLGLSGNPQSSAEQGYYLKDAQGNVVDAVALNGQTFAPSTGVTAADWSGAIPSSSTKAGVIRVNSDNNDASDWVISNTPSPLQTMGSFNPQLSISSGGGFGGCSSNRVQVTAYVTGIPPVDAGIAAVTEPAGNVSSGTPYPVKAIIKNYGTDTLFSANVNWSVNGILQTPTFNWTDTLLHDSVTQPLTIGTVTLTLGGIYTIKVWTSDPNSITDPYAINDTATTTVYLCHDGVITVGGTSGDYATINEAINSLKTAGVCGPVTISINPGVYTEQLDIDTINGVSAVNTLTFTSSTGDSTDVIITYGATGTTDNYTVRLNGASNIIFKNLTLQATGGTYAYVVDIMNSSSDIELSNNVIQSMFSTASDAAGIYSPSATSENNLAIKNNLILNGYYGIYLYGPSGNLESGNVIEGNTIEGFDEYGIYLYYQDSIIVRGNTINNSPSSAITYGIRSYYVDNGARFTKNKIHVSGTSSCYGIYLYYNDGTASEPVVAANNFVTQSVGSGTVYGIYSYNGNYNNIYYNTVNVTGGSATAGRAIYLNSSTSGSYGNADVENNIFANTGGGYAIEISSGAVTLGYVTSLDRNDYYATGPNIGDYAGTDVTDITTWRLLSGTDINSISADPLFNSNTDLHVNSSDLNALATPIAGITDDIDGELRNPTTPDIGADEFTVPPNDAGIIEIIAPNSPVTAGVPNDIIVKIKNFGDDTLKTAKIDWSVNGVLQTQYVWSNTPGLVAGAIHTDTIGSYNFTSGTSTIKAWSSDPNGQLDPKANNDTTVKTVISCQGALAGTYTVGGASADFPDFALVLQALQYCGVGGHVTFNINPGFYYGQINLTEVTGASDTSRITFQAANGDSSSVVFVHPSQTSSTDNHLVYLDGADYFTFKKLTLQRSGSGTYSRVVVLDNVAHDNTFESCHFLGVVATSSSTNRTSIYSDATVGESNIVIKNCRFVNNSYGIYLYGSSTPANAEPGIQVTGNIFENQYAYGLYLYGKDAPIVTNNTITSQTTSSSFYGINMYYCDNAMVVSNNKISVPNGNGYGIRLYYCDATVSAPGLISNNFVHTGSAGTGDYGIYCYSSNYQNIYHNSVNITGTSGRGFYLSSGGNINIVNNIFANNGTGLAAYYASTTAGNVIDYNNYYTTGATLAYWSGNRATLADLQAASSKDANSASVDPNYVSDGDLHVNSLGLDGQGMPLALVPNDIDGEPRDTLTPDIGADEFVPIMIDGGVVATSRPAGKYYAVGEQVYVKVVVKNFGIDTLTSFDVIYKYGLTLTETYSWVGILPQGHVDTVEFVTIPITILQGEVELKVYTNVTNDGKHSNDTISITLTGIPVKALPYYNDFEGAKHFYADGGQWQKGVPTGPTIKTAKSPVNAWVTNLNGNYLNNSSDPLYSPYFNFTIVHPDSIKFWHYIDVQPNNDGGYVQYLNTNGNWVTLGIQNDPNGKNWYNAFAGGKVMWSMANSGWMYSALNISSVNDFATPAQFRFMFYSNSSTNNYDGWAVDNFEVTIPKIPNDAGVISILSPSGPMVTGSKETVVVEIKNFGSNTLTSIPVLYVVNNQPPVPETWTGTLLPDSTVTYQFTTQQLTVPSSGFNLCAFTDLTGDTYPFNNTSCKNFTSLPAPLDAGVIAVFEPTDTTIIGSQVVVKVRMQNFGTDTITTMSLEYTVNGLVKSTETWIGSLYPGDSTEYTFDTTYMSPISIYPLCIYTKLLNDADPLNDMKCKSLVGVGINELAGNRFALGQNEPNPVGDYTKIEYYVPISDKTTFEIRNNIGQSVLLREEEAKSGINTIEINVSGLPAGLYYYSVEYKGERLSKKMIISR